MKFPCELLAEPYLAQLRIEITKTLNKLGYTQNHIADILQVSQPVISGYLKKSRNQSHLPQILLSKARETSIDISKLLISRGSEATEDAIRIGCKECKILRQSGPTCIYHKSVTENLSKNCSACLTQEPLLQLQIDKEGVLRDLSKLFEDLSSFDKIFNLIPEIGMQMIYSTNDPISMSDIAAFPGRIIKRKNRQLLAETPTFGGSETTSQLLLDLRKRNENLRSLIAIKTSEWLKKRLKALNITYSIIKGLEEDIPGKLSDLKEVPDKFVLIGTDSVGYESISYVVSKTTNEAKELLFDVISGS